MSTHRGIRYSPVTGWELRCESCSHDREQAFWPLTLEFWNPTAGMTRCRACWVTRNRYRRAQGRGGPRLLFEEQVRSNLARRAYQREWAGRKRAEQRASEGRSRYERRKAA